MTPEQFLTFADPLPEPTLLVSGDGLILAGNRAVGDRLGLAPRELRGRRLTDLAAEPADEVARYLRACSRGRTLVPGSLTLPGREGRAVAWRAEGALLRPRAEGGEAVLLLRLTPKESAVGQFVALNRRIGDLGKEILRRKQAEEEAREQEERLRTTLASIGDAVITTDAEGRVTNMNAVAEALTGWKGAEAAGRPLEAVFRIVNEQTRRPVENPATRALTEGVIVGLANHTVLIARDGVERPIDDSAAPIRCKEGEVVGCVLVFRDVTERRKAEERLRRDEARLRMALTAARMVAWQFDPATGRLIVSDNAADVFGLSPGARLEHGDQGFALVHPDDVGRHRAAVMRAAEEHGSYLSEFRMVRPDDGAVLWMEERGHAVREGPTEEVQLVGVVMDVTERKRAEELFRVMAENIPQLAWMAGPDGDIFWYNRRWYEYTGTGPDTQKGWGWQSVHDPDALPAVMERWKRSIATGEPFDMVFPLRGRDGAFRPFLTRIMPVKDAGGRVTQWFGTNTDVTEQRALEEALKEADRRKDEFLATLAHELRNPLAPIRNGLAILRLAGDGAAAEQARAMMERQLGRMVHLVDDLLDVSRISRGKLELRKERLELAAVLHSAVETSRPLIESAGHELTVRLPPRPVLLDGDATRLEQVFANLLNNAAKYSDRGGRIGLTAEPRDGEVVVSVRDAGVGIPADMLPKIFEMFTQVDRSLEKSQGGLGIGLTLVKRLVEMHGGSVEARSEGHGRGSEFVVRLPCRKEEGGRTKGEAGHSSFDFPPSSLRVLVADDNEDAASSLALMLRLLGNEVRTASDGLQAVEAASAFGPDVVLLDIGMPHLNGYEACRRIRMRPGGDKAVLVALTGWGQDEDRRRSREAGFDHHLVKPVEPALLEKLLAGVRASAGG